MTPHFSEYYSEKKPPSDDQSPIPVTFLTIAPGTKFAFAVGLRRGASPEDEQTARQAADWLTAGLQELGIGSKTAAGYGAFGERQDL
jgi:CRISPR-associated protein Cmr6